MCNHDRIGTGFFGEGNGDRGRISLKSWVCLGRAKGKVALVVGFRGAFFNAGDIFQVDGFAIWHTDDDVAHTLRVAQKTGQPHRMAQVVVDQCADGQRYIGAAQLLVDLFQADAGCAQPGGVDPDVDGMGGTARELGK